MNGKELCAEAIILTRVTAVIISISIIITSIIIITIITIIIAQSFFIT